MGILSGSDMKHQKMDMAPWAFLKFFVGLEKSPPPPHIKYPTFRPIHYMCPARVRTLTKVTTIRVVLILFISAAPE